MPTLIVLILAALIAPPLYGQQHSTVTGIVLDKDAKTPLEGVRVQIDSLIKLSDGRMAMEH